MATKVVAEINKTKAGLWYVGDVGIGGERGVVMSVLGLCPSQSATQYKDPIEVLVNEAKN